MDILKNSTVTNSYLLFKIANEIYAVHISQVINILELVRITEIPKSPKYMTGVINHDNKVLPIIDTRIKFNLSKTEYTKKTCIVIMNVKIDGIAISVGALIDEVVAVHEINKKEILDSPSIGYKYKSEFIIGMLSKDDHFIMILDIDKLFSKDELKTIEETANGTTKDEEKQDEEK